MTKLFIDGEHGTTGLQIREQMAARGDFQLLQIPHEHRHDVARREELLNEADFAILCLPDDAAREAVAMAGADTRIIDTSTAHRTHADWAYGFAEVMNGQREKIANAKLVANPGCYPTGALGFIAPLVACGILPKDYPISINAVSGYTGGGKALIAMMENADADGHIDANHFVYALGLNHKHLDEIKTHGALIRTPIFTPAVARFPQGMAVQIPLHLDLLASGTTRAKLFEALSDHYAGQNIVRIAPLEQTDAAPRLLAEELAGTDRMTLHITGNDEVVSLVALLDNLGKGASGAAIQNLDLMAG